MDLYLERYELDCFKPRSPGPTVNPSFLNKNPVRLPPLKLRILPFKTLCYWVLFELSSKRKAFRNEKKTCCLIHAEVPPRVDELSCLKSLKLLHEGNPRELHCCVACTTSFVRWLWRRTRSCPAGI